MYNLQAAREGNVKIADFGLSRSLAITREANKRGSMTDLASLAKRVTMQIMTCLLIEHDA